MLSPAVELSAEYWIGLSCISKEVLPVPFQQKYYHFITITISKKPLPLPVTFQQQNASFYVIVQAVFIV